MRKIKGKKHYTPVTPKVLGEGAGKEISLNACVGKIENMGDITLIMLRTERYLFQSIWKKDRAKNIRQGMYLSVSGIVREEKRAYDGYEIEIKAYEVLSSPKEEYPIPVTANHLKCSVETSMEYRTTALRHDEARAVFKLRHCIIKLIRDYMCRESFTELTAPKITQMAEDKRHAFKLKYFDEKAYLLSSLRLYTSMGVAFFDRTFEIGSVYKSNMHGSSRHLNEFTQLDFEMAYVSCCEDIINVLAALIKYVIKNLSKEAGHELELLNIKLPKANMISLTFSEALDILQKVNNQYDLDPTDTVKICKWAKDKHDTDLVFVEQFPAKKSAFDIKLNKDNPNVTDSIVLLFKGMSVAKGGIKINDYKEQLLNIKEKNTEQYAPYLETLKYGMPPFGGMSMGIERFIMQLLNLDNAREANMFPRDLHHIAP